MFRWCLTLLLTAVTCLAIPKSSSKRELQKLVRLPKLEFSRPLEFDRRYGFIAFPDANTAALDASKILKTAKGTPDEAPLYLQAAQIFEAHGDRSGALRNYARAVDLFRRRLEIAPREVKSAAGLGEALAALGRFTEAQSALEGTESGEPTVELLLARSRYYRERAWFSAAGEVQRYSSGTFLNQLISLVAEAAPPNRIEEAKKYLALSERCLAQAFAMEAGDKEEKLLERAAFRSLRSAMETAFAQIQNSDFKARALEISLYDASALEDLAAAAKISDDPSVIAASALAANFAAERIHGSGRVKEEYVRAMAHRLQQIAGSSGEDAAEAAEYLGSIQFHLFKDVSGARRTLQQALALQPSRYRSWELLTIASAYEGPERFVETAQARLEALPGSRSSVLLVKSYDMRGDQLRAEWTALNAVSVYPNDLLVNLTLAAVLLKDENAADLLWRAGQALDKAEKALGSSRNTQSRMDFVLLKSIYLGLSDQVEQARALLNSARPSSPEIREVLRVLE